MGAVQRAAEIAFALRLVRKTRTRNNPLNNDNNTKEASESKSKSTTYSTGEHTGGHTGGHTGVQDQGQGHDFSRAGVLSDLQADFDLLVAGRKALALVWVCGCVVECMSARV